MLWRLATRRQPTWDRLTAIAVCPGVLPVYGTSRSAETVSNTWPTTPLAFAAPASKSETWTLFPKTSHLCKLLLIYFKSIIWYTCYHWLSWKWKVRGRQTGFYCFRWDQSMKSDVEIISSMHEEWKKPITKKREKAVRTIALTESGGKVGGRTCQFAISKVRFEKKLSVVNWSRYCLRMARKRTGDKFTKDKSKVLRELHSLLKRSWSREVDFKKFPITGMYFELFFIIFPMGSTACRQV